MEGNNSLKGILPLSKRLIIPVSLNQHILIRNKNIITELFI